MYFRCCAVFGFRKRPFQFAPKSLRTRHLEIVLKGLQDLGGVEKGTQRREDSSPVDLKSVSV